MKDYKYLLEPLLKLELDKNRSRTKQCPCNKNNKDGKFVPFKKFDNRGYCHSCCSWFNVAVNTCNGCKTEYAFSKYIDTENGNAYLSNNVGKCLYCNYHYTPKQYFEDNKEADKEPKQKTFQNPLPATPPKTKPKTVSFIPVEIFKQSLKSHEANNFVQYLLKLFGYEITKQLIEKYFIGTSKHWLGATVFWQIDITGNVRTGKIMLYSATTGKRVKEPYNYVTWVQAALKLPEFELLQCFFGEQLLQDKTKPIAICESEKTAIIASVYLPEFIWIAAGSKNGLNAEKCKVLAGRKVTLFPDLNCFNKWKAKALEFSNIARFTVSDLLEYKASEAEKRQGLDLADYFIRFDYKEFQNKAIVAPESCLLDICSSDTLIAPILTYLGDEFDNCSLLYIETIKGKFDFLFDVLGELLQPGNEWLTTKIEAMFEKKFERGYIDGIPCFIYLH